MYELFSYELFSYVRRSAEQFDGREAVSGAELGTNFDVRPSFIAVGSETTNKQKLSE